MERLIQMKTCLGGGARRIASTAFPTLLLSLRGSTFGADLRLRLAWSASSAAHAICSRTTCAVLAMDDGTLQHALFAAHNTE